MAVAMMFPEKGRGKTPKNLELEKGKGEYLRQARTVLQYTPKLAEEVLAGGMPQLYLRFKSIV